jgi:exodeoxyribonuclease VII large subunit
MTDEKPVIYSVTEIVQTARALLENKLGQVLVQGEISKFTLSAAGHMYFTLKDQKCVLDCAFFRGANQGLAFKPESGLQVVAGGVLTLYEAQGKFQLNVRLLEPKGLGGLQLAFEQLKKKLMEEGLFEESRKKPIPPFPHKIALITSPIGAAIQDFMKILETRVGIDEVELFPVRVQGAEAPAEITAAIEEVSKLQRHDVLVVTRGGGSLEDLAAFNDEGVVRALANCSIPTISAVGHEVDFSLCDFVADRREPTPTAAASHIAPGIDETQAQLDSLRHRLQEAWDSLLSNKRRDLEEMANSLKERRPDRLLDQARQDLDMNMENLSEALQRKLKDRQLQLDHLASFISRFTPLQLIKPLRERLKGLEAGLTAYHPHAPLKRGYAIVKRKDTGKILRSSKDAGKGDRLIIELQKGSLESQVVSSKDVETNQESLF